MQAVGLPSVWPTPAQGAADSCQFNALAHTYCACWDDSFESNVTLNAVLPVTLSQCISTEERPVELLQ
jgi:hypothetical protein